MAVAEKQSAYPKTLWSATPGKQTRVLIPNQKDRTQIDRTLRFREGQVDVANAHEEAMVRKATRQQVWEQDLTTPKVDQQSGWVCYSSEAYINYLEHKRRMASAQPPR